LGVRISQFLVDRPLVSFFITAAVVTLMADSVRQVVPDESHVGVLTWVALVLMGYAVIATVVLARRVDPMVRPFVAWGVGVSPSIYGYAAALVGSPIFVMWFGVVLSLCLVAWVATIGVRSGAGEPTNGGPGSG
jgi:hypothetical protein